MGAETSIRFNLMLHHQTLIDRYENKDNPEVKTWADWIEQKFFCSCGYSKNMGLRFFGELGYETLVEEHVKWAENLKKGKG